MSIPVLLGGIKVSAIASSPLFNCISQGSDRVLVLIQLNGGNDGLNMVIPIDQYSGLSQVRSNILIPEASVLKLTDYTGLHPAMSGLQNLYKEGSLGIIQSVGYPNQNRSHFRSTDIWTSASDANVQLSTGWIGRYLNLNFPDYPENFPNPDYPDPLAITLGNLVSSTCQGTATNYSYALNTSLTIKSMEETEQAPQENSCYYDELSFIKTTIDQSNHYAERLLESIDKGNNLVEYPSENRLADQLKIVAKLISGGLQTQIYIVNLGGFDTHSQQVESDEHDKGEHATLLGLLSDAISSFSADLKALGITERVAGMTFSEFGRQIRSNNSIGTDHGTAAPVIVFGDCIKADIYGQNPEISGDSEPQEGVPMLYDFRSVYATFLIDWLGAAPDQVNQVLFNDFQKLSFIKNCQTTSTNQQHEAISQLSCYPNPCGSETTISFNNQGKYVHLSVYDILGSQLKVIVNKQIETGQHDIRLDMSGYPSGTYFIRVAIDNLVNTVRLIKL